MVAQPAQTMREVGEFGLIERLAEVIGRGAGPRPLIGLGDDAAAWVQPEAILVASTDLLVEGIHFDLALTTWPDLGWKALAVKLSDLAAMGATPAWALVSIGFPPQTRVEDVGALYEGLRRLADEVGCAIAGGDTVSVRADGVISVTVLGTLPAGEADAALRRNTGRPGDRLAVTGPTLAGGAQVRPMEGVLA